MTETDGKTMTENGAVLRYDDVIQTTAQELLLLLELHFEFKVGLLSFDLRGQVKSMNLREKKRFN